MKCPQCGQWNRASQPICIKCGTPLEQSAAPQEPTWRKNLKDGAPRPQYRRVNDLTGELDNTPDSHETLAGEMAELKVRKDQGDRMQQNLRTGAQAQGLAPTGDDGSAAAQAGNTFWRFSDDPGATVRVSRGPVGPEDEEGFAGYMNDDIYDANRAYNPTWADGEVRGSTLPPIHPDRNLTVRLPSRRRGRRAFLRVLVSLLIVTLAGLAGFFGWHYYQQLQASKPQEITSIVTETIHNGLPAHTIMIPGNEGDQIYIGELRSSYIVTGGFATIEIEDHYWYDDDDTFLNATAEAKVTPFLKTAAGTQKPLPVITYSYSIPESTVSLVTPDSYYQEVSASMYTMELDVKPGSTVTINGRNVTDTVNSETGRLSYNATVNAIGNNEFNIVVRSQYCRETSMVVTLYREPQAIQLDLAADTYTSTSQPAMQVHMTTKPGAYVEVLSPHTDLDISKIYTTGEFSFYATWSHIGNNDIIVTASDPDRPQDGVSTLTYTVYYVPSIDVYSRRAWPMNSDNYAELLNTNIRAEQGQVYVITGYVAEIYQDKPQRVKIFSKNGDSLPVVLQNNTRTTWVEGQYYRIYADADTTFDNMPVLQARYTYTY